MEHQQRYRCKTSSYQESYARHDAAIIASTFATGYTSRVLRRERENSHMVFAWDSENEAVDSDLEIEHVDDHPVADAAPPPPPHAAVAEIEVAAPNVGRMSLLAGAPARRSVVDWHDEVPETSASADLEGAGELAEPVSSSVAATDEDDDRDEWAAEEEIRDDCEPEDEPEPEPENVKFVNVEPARTTGKTEKKKTPFAMYGGGARLGKSYGKNKETFNVNGAREVKPTAIRAGQGRGSPRRPPLKPAPEDRRNRRPKARATPRRKKKAEPIETHSVYQASVVSTRGSGAENDEVEVSEPSRRRNPYGTMAALLAKEAHRRKGDWCTEYTDNFHQWPTKVPEFRRPTGANAPGGPHVSQLTYKARQYHDEEHPVISQRAWR